jgi:catechol 2,3-dioxygenase-like lactoylglutathione lyase family enzyme
MSRPRLSHIGLCVSDVERAQRFFEEGLGFRYARELDVKGELPSTLLRLRDVELHAVYLDHGGTVIELLHYASPGHEVGDSPRPLNRLGLTHVSFLVDELDAVLPRLAELGGKVLAETRIEPGGGMRAIFVTDPDGTLIELVQQGQG